MWVLCTTRFSPGPTLFHIFIYDSVKAAPMFNYILFADEINIFMQRPLTFKDKFEKYRRMI